MACAGRPPSDALASRQLTTDHYQGDLGQLPVVLANKQLPVLSLLVQDLSVGLNELRLLLSLQGEGEERPGGVKTREEIFHLLEDCDIRRGVISYDCMERVLG